MSELPIRIETLAPPVVERDLHALAELLSEAVASGAAVSFLAPLPHLEALAWWRGVFEKDPRQVIVLVARSGEQIVGTAQIQRAWAPNQPHRGDVAKVLVHREARGRGLGSRLMRAIEDAALDAGLRLLTLDTKRESAAERLYRRLGWTAVGTIPRFALDPDGAAFHDDVIFYKELVRTREEEIWRKYDATERRLAAPLTERMIDLAGLEPGMRVLDIAAGRGEPAIPAARHVLPAGRVLAIDHSESMLRMAQERATLEGVPNVDFEVRDAESLTGIAEGTFDRVLARWCLMYFATPRRALAEAHRVLRSGGTFVAAVWAEPERVPYFTLPRQVLARYVPIPPLRFDEPGTFRYSEPGALERDLVASGLRVVASEDLEVDVMEATTRDELVAWCRAFGLERLLTGLSPEIQRAWEADLLAAAESRRKHGRIRLGGVTHIVVATKERERAET